MFVSVPLGFEGELLHICSSHLVVYIWKYFKNSLSFEISLNILRNIVLSNLKIFKKFLNSLKFSKF